MVAHEEFASSTPTLQFISFYFLLSFIIYQLLFMIYFLLFGV